MADIKLYPSKKEFQRSGDAEVPLVWAITYLSSLRWHIPEHERDAAVLRGWNAVEVHYAHKMTDEEIAEQRVMAVLDALHAAQQSGQGMTADQIKHLLSQLPG